MKRFIGGKRRIVMLVATLVALAIGVTVGLAKSGPTQVKSNVFLRSFFGCPPTLSKNATGTVTINNVKGDWTIVVHMRGAKPGSYHVDLQDTTCTQFADRLGHFKVGADGTGDGKVSYSASGFQSFYLRVHDSDQDISYFTPRLKIGGNPS
jgi:hypothetical protein